MHSTRDLIDDRTRRQLDSVPRGDPIDILQPLYMEDGRPVLGLRYDTKDGKPCIAGFVVADGITHPRTWLLNGKHWFAGEKQDLVAAPATATATTAAAKATVPPLADKPAAYDAFLAAIAAAIKKGA